MLGGMPVAVAAGHALSRMREQSGLEVPLPTEHIVMACVRDTDPLEQERLDDPAEVMGHPLTVPNGPTSRELADAMTMMFRFEKAAALGIASYPADGDPEKVTMRGINRLILGAVRGVQAREGG